MIDALTSGDPGYAAELAGMNTAFPLTPKLVVPARSAQDVTAAIDLARDRGLAVRAFATGHGTHAPISDGLVINISRLDSVVVDPAARTATIGGGSRWAPVVAAAAEHGLAPVTGSAPGVGAVGFLLGGGLGPLARTHGFGSDWVRSVTIATADGALRTASATENPELFWALRGGKGGLGVVTEVTIALAELPALYGGALVFAEEHIEAALRGWAAWTTDAPAEVTTSVAVVSFPPLDEVPEPFRGRRLLMLRVAYPGDALTGEQLVEPLRALAPVYLDGVRPMSPAEIGLIHNDPSNPGPSWGLGGGFSRVDDGLVDALLPFVGSGATAPFIAIEVRHVAGAPQHDVPEGSAVGGRDVPYFFHLIGVPDLALFADVLPRAGAAFLDAVEPWVAPTTTANWSTPATIDRVWAPEVAARLARIRTEVDPHGLFPVSL